MDCNILHIEGWMWPSSIYWGLLILDFPCDNCIPIRLESPWLQILQMAFRNTDLNYANLILKVLSFN